MSQDHIHHHSHEKKTLWVVLLTAVTMVVEIIYGITTNSMALLADGIHMGSHVLAIGLSWLAYVYIRKTTSKNSHSGTPHKILSLSGYTSGLILLVFAFFIIIEAIERFFAPLNIAFSEAITVATIGLIVNIISAFLLHHHHSESDHNIKAAYIHVIADALTSISAILGLIIAKYMNLTFLDTVVALISSAVIIKWAIGLLKESGKVLIDFKTN